MRRSVALKARDRVLGLAAQAIDAARVGWRGYGLGLVAVGAVTILIGAIEARRHIANISMLYLIAVLATATFAGRAAAIIASLAAFLAFNWFFVEPLHTFTVGDPVEWVALLLFLITAGITGQLAAGERERAREAAERAREATLLFQVAHTLSGADLDTALASVAMRVRESLDLAGVVIEIEDETGARRISEGDVTTLAKGDAVGSLAAWIPSARPTDRAAARWIRVIAPRHTGATVRNERIHAVPLMSAERRVGTLAVVRAVGEQPRSTDDRVLSTVGEQLASAIERARLRRRATETEVLVRADELKNALLNAVSHDLRTPLASIIASAGSLRQADVRWTDIERATFLADIEQEARRLSRIVDNLLDLSRMESGTLHPERGWYDVAALIDDVVGRLRPLLGDRTITVRVPEDLPPISLDYVEIDQVLSNLIENASRHTRAGTAITVTASVEGPDVMVEVADDGPGIDAESLGRLFEPFFRGPRRGTPRGTGLGLAVARGLVEAHGGRITAENRPEGGALFRFSLPIDLASRTAVPARA